MADPFLDVLHTLGRVPFGKGRVWPDYREWGAREEHVPALIGIIEDETYDWMDGELASTWAPLHAWRALGQLRAGEAIAPLLAFLDRIDDDDWAREEIPDVLVMIGRAAFAPMAEYLADRTRDLWDRLAVARGLHELAESDPSVRDDVVAVLIRQLEKWWRHDETLNGFLILHLAELRVTDAAPLMKAAFDADRVDTIVMGDWEDVQVMLGLIPERVTPHPVAPPLLPIDEIMEKLDPAPKKKRRREKRKKRRR